MRRTLTMVGFVILMSLLQAAEVQAGASAGETFISFTGPAFSATVVLNPDSLTLANCDFPGEPCPRGTVAIRLSKGNTNSGAIFADTYVAGFANGCDGNQGASIPSGEGIEAKTATRFVGVSGWIPSIVETALLALFGITPDTSHPLVFSDVDNPVCTDVGGVFILSFTGTMQFG